MGVAPAATHSASCLQAGGAVVAFHDALPAVGVGGDRGAAGTAGAGHEDQQGQQDDQDAAARHDVPDGGEVEIVEVGFHAESSACAGSPQSWRRQNVSTRSGTEQ